MLAAQCLFSTQTMASPQATFSGEGSAEKPSMDKVDDFPGIDGDGWLDSWQMISQKPDAVSVEAAIVKEKPLSADSGNRLQISYERLGGKNGNRAGVVRQFSNEFGSGGIDPLKPYQVKFQFRLDQVSGNFSDQGDQVTFAGSTKLSRKGLSEDEEWVVIYSGRRARLEGGDWMAIQRNEKGETKPFHFGPDGQSLDLDAVYEVTISIDPSAGIWDAEVSRDGVTFRASEANDGLPLQLLKPADAEGARFLSFRTSRDGEGKTMTWSIDNVAVLPGE